MTYHRTDYTARPGRRSWTALFSVDHGQLVIPAVQ